MTRSEILSSAADCVLRDRAATHGEPEDGFEAIEAVWQALDMARGKRSRAASDVALYLAGLKLVRAATNPEHSDNWVDLAGYAACGGEIAMGGRPVFDTSDFPFEIPQGFSIDPADMSQHASRSWLKPETDLRPEAEDPDREVDQQPLAALSKAERPVEEQGADVSKPQAPAFLSVWTDDESRMLLDAVMAEGLTIVDAAARVGRTASACKTRLRLLRGNMPERAAPAWAEDYIRQLTRAKSARKAAKASKTGGRVKAAPKAKVTPVAPKAILPKPAPMPAAVAVPAKLPAPAADPDSLTMPQKDLLRQLKRLDDSFTPEDDLLMAQQLVDGVKAPLVALELEIMVEYLQKRWRTMTNAAISIDPQAPLNGQRDLLAVLRHRVAVSA